MTKSIKILCLSFNNIETIDILEIMRNIPSLITFDISNNSLNTLSFNENQFQTFKHLSSNLEFLDISFNCIRNFTEIFEIILHAYKPTNKPISDGIFTNLSSIGFFGNPINYNITDYLLQRDSINLFDFNLDASKNSPKKKSHEKSNSEIFNFEVFIPEIKKILHDLQINSLLNQEPEDGCFSSRQDTEISFTNIKTYDKFYNKNLKEIKKIDLNIGENSYINDNIKTEINSNNINLIEIERLKTSEMVEKIIKYNLIDDLKQFNVIYHTYSFKKIYPEEEPVFNEKRNKKISLNSQMQNVNEVEFKEVFQEKVDNDKSSNVLLLSKQKLTTIPILAKSVVSENQVDLIFLKNRILLEKSETKKLIENDILSINTNSFINYKVKYDTDCQKLIKVIYININKLTNLSYLDQFIFLEELYIQNNKLKSLPNFPMENLKKIDISNNNLNSLKGVSYLKKLVYLNVENNFLNNLCLKELLSLEDLQEFNASGNNIYNLKECILLKSMKKLFNLDLGGNEVCNNGDFRLSLINYLPKLRILNRIPIEKNEFSIAKEYFEGRLTSEILERKIGSEKTLDVIQLDLSNNKLKDFDNIFNNINYPNLKKLDLSKNLFSNFRIFDHMPNLEELYLNFNMFERILNKKDKTYPNKGILGLLNLEILEISENNLTDLTGIQALKNLKTLVLRENNLNRIDAIDGLINLQYLDISFNKLRNIERSNIGLLPNLKTLICDSNYLKNINSFSKLQSLIYISFDNNKISEISNVERLVELEYLKEINLSNNPITKTVNYRVNLIRKFFYIVKIDGIDVTKEEKEIAIMDQTCQPVLQGNDQIHPNSIYMAKMENTKMAMKVNFVNLDLMLGNGGLNIVSSKIMNHDENINFRDKNISPLRANSMDPSQYAISLPHINPMSNNINSINIGFNNIKNNISGISNIKKISKQYANNSTMNPNQILNNVNQKNTKNQKMKITSLPLGNLFKQIGEVISGGHQNENLANLINKISNQNKNYPLAQFEISKPISRPKSITYRK